MRQETNRIDALVADLAYVRDDELVRELTSSRATTLLATIVETPVASPSLRSRRRITVRVRLIAVAAAFILAAVLSIPAFGVGQDIVSFFAGWGDEPDYPAPVPTASDVVIASGEAGVPWRIVATTSDQGLCLGLVYRMGGEEGGNAGCGYLDIRGDLAPDVRGNPATECLATPTTLVPCGSLPRHWVDFARRSDGPDFTRMIVFGPAADGVASVDLVLTNGQTVRAHLVEQPEGLHAPVNFYWAALPLDGGYRRSLEVVEPVEMVVARDSAGRVLERRVASWNGNPTGDLDGPALPSSTGS